MSSRDKPELRCYLEAGGEAEAVMHLLTAKGRSNKASAISFCLSSLFEILKDKNILNIFFTEEIIALYKTGKSPQEIQRFLEDKKRASSTSKPRTATKKINNSQNSDGSSVNPETPQGAKKEKVSASIPIKPNDKSEEPSGENTKNSKSFIKQIKKRNINVEKMGFVKKEEKTSDDSREEEDVVTALDILNSTEYD